MLAYRLLDDFAERYLDLVDTLDDEIDELEDRVETQPAELTRSRISSLRHDLLHIRRTLSPMRDSVRRAIDNTVEVDDGPQVFPHDVEVAFNAPYDKFLRASDGLDLARDLLAGVRDYRQAKIANDQNDVMKRLTLVASLLLLPTFIVGLYGQNFVNIPELRWSFGYGYVWGVIVSRRPYSSGGSAVTTGSDRCFRGYPGAVPHFICPNCKERSVHVDEEEGFFDEAPACHRCGFGFLFELMDDYYPAPTTGFVTCDQEGRILALGRGVFELSGWSEEDVLGTDVVSAFGLAGFEEDKNPVKLSLEWGVRRLDEQLQLRTRGGQIKRVVGDFFPALDDDGGLLVALTPAHS